MKIEKKKMLNEIPVTTLSNVFESIKAVGRGDAELPNWAGGKVYIGDEAKQYWENIGTNVNSLDSFSKLYSDNKDLIAAIANHQPESIVSLAKLISREESNVSRTLNKLEKFGLVALIPAPIGRAKRPILIMQRVRFDLDLLSGQMSLTGIKQPIAA
ncbi:HVO_A0114 family putative DNA-binding protein [Polynucleobacter kasalickyi]|uniref:Uncharacterized protein n=1 Tax=Polynucleobacter kasalickyi TaxID=1938817 RepID=A0A1W2A8L4_9BURK|nr:hypothetical protein [Polynucleobacter kasalickyi]SMC56812.1 hypothetical protein SAMN06296008_10818 [Polynucleobacter kasalickyi]